MLCHVGGRDWTRKGRLDKNIKNLFFILNLTASPYYQEEVIKVTD